MAKIPCTNIHIPCTGDNPPVNADNRTAGGGRRTRVLGMPIGPRRRNENETANTAGPRTNVPPQTTNQQQAQPPHPAPLLQQAPGQEQVTVQQPAPLQQQAPIQQQVPAQEENATPPPNTASGANQFGWTPTLPGMLPEHLAHVASYLNPSDRLALSAVSRGTRYPLLNDGITQSAMVSRRAELAETAKDVTALVTPGPNPTIHSLNPRHRHEPVIELLNAIRNMYEEDEWESAFNALVPAIEGLSPPQMAAALQATLDQRMVGAREIVSENALFRLMNMVSSLPVADRDRMLPELVAQITNRPGQPLIVWALLEPLLAADPNVPSGTQPLSLRDFGMDGSDPVGNVRAAFERAASQSALTNLIMVRSALYLSRNLHSPQDQLEIMKMAKNHAMSHLSGAHRELALGVRRPETPE